MDEQGLKETYFPPAGAVVVAFFFLPFGVVLLDLVLLDLVLFDVDFVAGAGFSWANTAIPLSSDRPSIRLIIFFMVFSISLL
jgi:hypothetical protein